MGAQIAVRLDDDDIAFIDDLIAQNRVASRADAVRRALELLRRQEDAQREIALLQSIDGPIYPDLEGMHQHLRRHRPALDD